MNVMVMSGTSDAVKIITYLHAIDDTMITATTTTSYGAKLASDAGADEVKVGGLGLEAMLELIQQKKIDLLLDATHPFASQATETAINAANSAEIEYLRFERPAIPHQTIKNLHVEDFREASKKASELISKTKNGRIMHLAGVSTLPQILEKISPHSIIVRVLPAVYSIKKCLELGIPSENIVAMQGTFSSEFNRVLMAEFNVDVVITKESGESGGTLSKLEAASQLEIPVVMVKRPEIKQLNKYKVYSDISELITEVKKFKSNMG
ncbi:MAG: precorrin-6A reductase [Methanobacterium sp. ERen5]|nr:MAG: precorrin-6A reductase [Methanobacterium sp. ERen5]